MEAHEIEQLRRSVAMLPPGHSAGALTKEQAEDLIAELAAITVENARYRAILAELRRIVAEAGEAAAS